MPPRSPSVRIASKIAASPSRKSKTMNAFAVGTPASTIAGSSATGSSIPPRIAGLSAKSTAASDDVTRRNSSMPARIERWAARDEPVPGLLNARNVVVPPNAAATESWKKRSGSSSLATRVWVWTSMQPGQDEQAARVDDLARPRPPGPTGPARPPSIEPPRTATSARRGAARGHDRPAHDQQIGP